MVEEPDNLVLRQLREFRAEMAVFRNELKQDMAALKEEMAALKEDTRKLTERVDTIEQSAALTIGYLVQSNLRDNRFGRDLAMLSNRVSVIEQHIGLTPQH